MFTNLETTSCRLLVPGHWTEPWELKQNKYHMWILTTGCLLLLYSGMKGLFLRRWECCWQKALSCQSPVGSPCAKRATPPPHRSPHCMAEQGGAQHSHPNLGQFRGHSICRAAQKCHQGLASLHCCLTSSFQTFCLSFPSRRWQLTPGALIQSTYCIWISTSESASWRTQPTTTGTKSTNDLQWGFGAGSRTTYLEMRTPSWAVD